MLAVLPLRAQASNADEPPGPPSKDAPSSLLSLNHDNDFFLLTDRYYSFGLDLSYRRSLPENPGGFRSQVGISLFLKAYTPRNIESDLSSDFVHRYGRNSYRFRFQYDSPGARGNLSHKFMGFTYGYAF